MILMADLVRFPVEPLLERLGVLGGVGGGQQEGQALEGAALLAARLDISHRMAQFLIEGRPERPHGGGAGSFVPAVHGLTESQADRYAIAAGFMPWEVWPDWCSTAPGEEDLRSKRCRCRPENRMPVGDECDTCGRRISRARRKAA